MTNKFSNSTRYAADYSYLTGFIRLYNITSELASSHKLLLGSKPESLPKGDWYINQYSTMLHEIIHFIDLSTTVWGLEFQYRKARVLEYGISDAEAKERASVFMLNYAEIDMHNKLSRIYKSDINLFECKFLHAYTEHPEYGYIAVLEFWHDTELVCDTPINMLAVLECNATAAELLSQLEYSKDDPEKTNQLISQTLTRLSNVQFLEYNSLLILCIRAFEFSELKEKLLFFRCLIKFALNLNGIACSELADALKYNINNRVVYEGVAQDMRRAMSRHFIVFKMLLEINDFLFTPAYSAYQLLFKNDPSELIDLYIGLIGVETASIEINQLERFTIAKHLEKHQDIFDVKIILESNIVNGSLIDSNPNKLFFPNELTLPFLILDDDYVIPSKCLSYNEDLEMYTDRLVSQEIRFEKIIENIPISKFYMNPWNG